MLCAQAHKNVLQEARQLDHEAESLDQVSFLVTSAVAGVTRFRTPTSKEQEVLASYRHRRERNTAKSRAVQDAIRAWIGKQRPVVVSSVPRQKPRKQRT